MAEPEESGSIRTRLGMVIAGLAILAGVGYAGWLWYASRPAALPAPVVVAPAPPAPKPQGPPPARFPIDSGADSRLPSLAESDGPWREAVTGVDGLLGLGRLLVTPGLIHNIVATVDALPREKVARRVFPVEATPGRFRVGANGTFGADNARRYDPWMKMIRAVPPAQAAAVYRRFYPLFQQAYRELGYPDGHFNDRLVEVIDDLLSTPETAFPIKVTAPGVMYQYADPALESLPIGQKMLLRLGPANLSDVKAKLREFRKEIAGS